jgi:methylase of polypeptide subunit release factors
VIPWSEPKLLACAMALGARNVPGWSDAERRLVRSLPRVDPRVTRQLAEQLRSGGDPLGDLFTQLRPPDERRSMGATYTPRAIVQAMVAKAEAEPTRVVDPGAGSGRFMVEAGRRFEKAELVGIELDPTAAILARGSLAAAGLANRSTILLEDYRAAALPPSPGPTLFVGNPPYVRHHLIESKWKDWLSQKATALGLGASQLAGLHVYFFLATVLNAQAGDTGAFITAAEWLDVNYGKLLRDLFLGPLGGLGIVVIEPTALPFPDAATTAAVTSFRIGAKPASVFLKRVDKLDALAKPNGGRMIRRERLQAEARWSHLTYPGQKVPEGYVELGELCRVHRGQVTGANRVWIEGLVTHELPDAVLFPTVTRARELISCAPVLEDANRLRRVVDLPEDLDALDQQHRGAVDRFIRKAKQLGAHKGYIARHRRAWWSVGLRSAAPILATYMARRPPAFVRNLADARHLNIAHGIYPRDPMPEKVLRALVAYLGRSTRVAQGRTYAGGLTKFEPREMERLLVPAPAMLATA